MDDSNSLGFLRQRFGTLLLDFLQRNQLVLETVLARDPLYTWKYRNLPLRVNRAI